MMPSRRITAPLSANARSITYSFMPYRGGSFSHKFVNRDGTMMVEMPRIASILIGLILLASLSHAQREFRSSPRFEAPTENFRAATSLENVQAELERGNFNEAATQIESLLKSNADEIASAGERGLMSIGNWLD